MHFEEKATGIFLEAASLKKAMAEDSGLLETLGRVTNIIIDCFKAGNKVLFCGNGGSAADAQHLAAEFSGRFYFDRDPLPSEALHTNTSYVTAVANDYGYELIYSRIVKGSGKPGDVLIGLSTSGNSKNIVLAMEAARAKQMTTIAMVGKKGGLMTAHADFVLKAPSTDTPRIQECHMLIGHTICQLVEAALFTPKS
jgi:D-sedoheptulose 7-phosphate isomerase